MMQMWIDVGGFALRAGVVVIAVAAIVLLIAGLAGRRRGGSPTGRLRLRHLNKRLRGLGQSIERAGLGPKARKALAKATDKAQKAADKEADKAAIEAAGDDGKAPPPSRSRVFVLDFEGDLRASGVDRLREEISAVVAGARDDDEVLLRLGSPGGAVTGYGLAASQLARLRERGVKLTVAVDQIAASGGYMMAAVADRILAAPFAVVGSIGVVATVPNLRRFLAERDIDVEQITAGRFKRTLSLFGEITEEGRAHFQQDLEAIHQQFKAHIARYRPDLDVDAVATGGHWTAAQALELGLVDALQISDDYLIERAEHADLFEVRWEPPVSIRKRLGVAVEDAAVSVAERLLSRWGRGLIA